MIDHRKLFWLGDDWAGQTWCSSVICLPSQLSQQRSSALQIASDDRSSEESASQKMIISLPNNVHGRQFTDWPLNSS